MPRRFSVCFLQNPKHHERLRALLENLALREDLPGSAIMIKWKSMFLLRRAGVVMFLSLLLCSVLGSQPQPDRSPALSMKAEHLLQILLNPEAGSDARTQAAQEVDRHREYTEVIDRLIAFLRDEDEAVVRNAVTVLCQLSTARALEALERTRMNIPVRFAPEFGAFLEEEIATSVVNREMARRCNMRMVIRLK
jgi:HEAT repeats